MNRFYCIYCGHSQKNHNLINKNEAGTQLYRCQYGCDECYGVTHWSLNGNSWKKIKF